MVDTTQAHPIPANSLKNCQNNPESLVTDSENLETYLAIARHWQWIAYQGSNFFIQNDSEWCDSAHAHDIQDAISITNTEDSTGPHGDRGEVIKNLQTPD